MTVLKTNSDPTALSQPMEPSDPAERECLPAEAEIESGRGVPHTEVQSWLMGLAITVPNAVTREAIQEARGMTDARFANAGELFDSLGKDSR